MTFAKTIIEVGGHGGDDTIRLLDGGKNRVFAFEPSPEMMRILQRRLCQYDGFMPVPMAVDLEESWRWFYEVQGHATGCSSLHPFNAATTEGWIDEAELQTIRFRVMTARLDTFIRKQGIETIDYLWIDAQGNDFRVLQSLGSELDRVREGKCEAAHVSNLYTGVDNDYRTISKWLQQRGFETVVVPDGGNMEADVHFRRI